MNKFYYQLLLKNKEKRKKKKKLVLRVIESLASKRELKCKALRLHFLPLKQGAFTIGALFCAYHYYIYIYIGEIGKIPPIFEIFSKKILFRK